MRLLTPANSAHLRSLQIWWCTANHIAQPKHSHSMRITLYRVTFNMAHRNAGRKLVSCLCTLQQRHPCAENGATVPRNNTRAAYVAMPPHADHWPRGRCAGAKYHRSTGGVRPEQTEIIPVRVEGHETAHEAEHFLSRMETYKQRFRGVVVVQHTRSDVSFTGRVVWRHLEAICSRLSSHMTLASMAHKSNRQGCRCGVWRSPYLRSLRSYRPSRSRSM